MFSSPGPPPTWRTRGNQKQHTPNHGHNALRPREQVALFDASPSPSPLDSPLALAQQDRIILSRRREFADTRTPQTFCSRPEFSITLLSTLPVELVQSLRSSYSPSRGFLYGEQGYAAIALPESTFIWKYCPSSSPCFVFPNPVSTQLPLACLVPRPRQQDPGLLLTSPTGSVRFWTSLTLGLTGGERYHSAQVPLAKDELVSYMVLLENMSFLLGTSNARLFRIIILTNETTSLHVNVQPLINSKSIISKFASSVFPSMKSPEYQPVVKVVKGGRQQNDAIVIWVLFSRKIQRWIMSVDAWDELVHEQSAHSLLAAAGISFDGGSLIQLHDVAIQGDILFILASFQLPGELDTTFILIQLASGNVLSTFAFPPGLGKRGNIHHLGVDLNAIFLCFEKTIVVQFLNQGESSQFILDLKDSDNRILSISMPLNKTQSSLDILTLDSGLLHFQANGNALSHFSSTTATSRLRTTLEQQIFFGTNSANPFAFRFETPLQGSIGLAAEQLSDDIVSSRCSLLENSLDMRTSLSERRTALLSLINTIADNHALNLVLPISRQRLWLDANRLVIAEALWNIHNQNYISRPGPNEFLSQGIQNIMSQISEAYHDDSVRLFFKNEVLYVVDLFISLQVLLSSLPLDTKASRSYTEGIITCSAIITTMWDVSENHRIERYSQYALPSDPSLICVWRSDHIDSCHHFFNEVARCLDAASDHGFDSTVVHQLGSYADDLANMTFSMWESLYEFQRGTGINTTQCVEAFTVSRAEVLQVLVRLGRASTASSLAKRYQEFAFLVQLTTSGLRDAPDSKSLLEEFKEPFALHLYKWYSENGQSRELLEPNPASIKFLDVFFEHENLQRIQWIFELSSAVSRFRPSCTSLKKEASIESKLDTRHVMLSLAKLSSLSEADSLDLSDSPDALSINCELEVISVQEALRLELQQSAGVNHRFTSINAICEAITSSSMSVAVRKHVGLYLVYKNLIKDLILGFVLGWSQLAELLSMKGSGDRRDNLSMALLIMPPSQVASTVLVKVWRRIFLAENWAELSLTNGKSDEEVDALLRRTALFGCLSSIRDVGRDDLRLAPDDCLAIPSLNEVSEDHPELTTQQVLDLCEAFEREQSQLTDFINNCSLSNWYHLALQQL